MNMLNSSKNRFMARDGFREYMQNILDRRGKAPFMEIPFSLAMRVINASAYVDRYEYTHADVKASRLLLDFGDDNENVYLVDFDSSCRYMQKGKYKECQEDLRKAHDGTTEFRSGDAYIGVHERSGDMELLGYMLRQCLCYRLPWKDNLKNPPYLSQQKSTQLENIALLMSKCFQHRDIPCGITEFLQYAASTKFENTPDCKRLKRITEKGIQAAGFEPYSSLHLTPTRTPRRNSFSPKKPVLQEIILAEDSMGVSVDDNVAEKPPLVEVTHGRSTTVRNNNRRTHAVIKTASVLDGLAKSSPSESR